ncbi:MAG: Holliday junction resolvase [Candidatus Thermoplasmatota archaeon]|jgi:Holliday junction resolvase|nr:Holliday junction resolvase [Candidatus Thermoplasmatota archaeon]MEC7626297.1 Holliday junction resolvase [Candidatus Thermoplasmatota archaeon]MEC8340972.1 Holliday junction resolvase [Candidatus Thermoplasmatota archaeon]MEC8519530.1 Holliday junction resolvase [Candidatus Thermoplasmatota archaeon]MEC8576141.1 Holliday junction resolvase [Candidatus Thermoplasmatota archaeon]|tara:strand:- start:25 stop:687 length:663 start_codon:yes stop_codon:yes gene_type:complete
MTGAYERELREVLAGTEKGVHAVTKSCSPEEKSRMSCVIERPFLVVRAAGSGMEGSGDLVALRGDCCFPIEVKSTRPEKLYFSGRTKDQLNAMIREGERSGLMPLYAHRRKGVRGDSWRIFRVETVGLTGTLARLATMIPALPLNRNGSPFIDWNQGMPLNRFIGLLCSPEGETAPLKALSKRAAHQTTTMAEDTQRSTDDILAELARRRSALLPFKGKE